MDLREFVQMQRSGPKPAGAVIDGQIVEGLGPGAWSAEDLTAEAFHQDVLSYESESWESGLRKVRFALASLRQHHGGPGPHKSGSSQDVHGDPGASTPYGAPAPDGGNWGPRLYTTRAGRKGDVESFRSGMPADIDEWSIDQQFSDGLFDPEKSVVILDSGGDVQAFFEGRPFNDFYGTYGIPPEDVDYFTDGADSGYEIQTLGVAPRHLGAGGERGWGLTAIRESIRDARSKGSSYIFLVAGGSADGFYKNIGFLHMEELGYEGFFVMPEQGMEKFEEAYDARFKK